MDQQLPYEAPRIDRRTEVGPDLIGGAPSPSDDPGLPAPTFS